MVALALKYGIEGAASSVGVVALLLLLCACLLLIDGLCYLPVVAGLHGRRDAPRQKRAQGMALMGGANSLGAILGPAIGGGLAFMGLLFPMYVTAGIMFAGAIWAIFILREPVRAISTLNKSPPCSSATNACALS